MTAAVIVVSNVGYTVIFRHQLIFFLFLLHFHAFSFVMLILFLLFLFHFDASSFVIFILFFVADVVLRRPKPGRCAVPLELVPRKVPDGQLAQLALQVALHQGADQLSPVRAVLVFAIQRELPS
jgi:hypothetical protein